MTVIATSTASTATAYSNQRKVDRCQNGVLWALLHSGNNNRSLDMYYSSDNGATWAFDARVTLETDGGYLSNGSLFIDLDDYAHVVYKSSANGYIYYRRGTPNAGRTSWTWSAAFVLHNFDTREDYPDIVVHREGSGWVAHVVHASYFSTVGRRVTHQKVTIASDGTPSKSGTLIYSNAHTITSANPYPSIDFNHTGDGKTVAGSTPHLYAAWSAGTTGSGYGIRFKKATYSGGSWTWGTEREIDSNVYVPSSNYWLNCLFDGTRVIIPGFLNTGAAFSVVLHERDADDTTTTTRTLVASASEGAYLFAGSATYDGDGNVYFFGRDSSGGVKHLDRATWTRATTTLGAHVEVDAGVDFNPYVSAKRGYSDNRIEFIYTDGTSSPYDVTYGAILLNADPNTPTNLAVTSDVTDNTPVFEADVSDPDGSQQIKSRFQIYQSDGTTLVGTIDSTFTAGSHTASAEYASALPVGTYKVQAATVDDAGAISSYTSQITFYVKTTVTDDSQLIWNVDALISKDLGLVWNVNISNQKDLELTWNVREQVLDSLEITWNTHTPWTLLEADPENNPVTWDKVAP